MGALMGFLGVSTIQSGEINWVLVLTISSIFLINYGKKNISKQTERISRIRICVYSVLRPSRERSDFIAHDTKGRIVSLVICQVIIAGFLLTDVYVFTTKESVIAKALAAVSFVIFMLMTLMILKSISILKDNPE